jgi:aryl-alcohol dehydrogenase-like predicted oxidoreductase
VAPAYGDGLDELELGLAVAGRRDEVRITTKYGISVPLYGAWSRSLFPAFRVVDKYVVPSYSKRHHKRCFEPQELRRSLEGSLKRLRTDYVDCLLVHEPLQPISPDLFSHIADAAVQLEEEGKVRSFGMAGTLHSIGAFTSHPAVDVIQAPLGELKDAAMPPQPALIAFGVYEQFRKGGRYKGSFLDFVRRLQREHPSIRLILATTRMATLASFKELLA